MTVFKVRSEDVLNQNVPNSLLGDYENLEELFKDIQEAGMTGLMVLVRDTQYPLSGGYRRWVGAFMKGSNIFDANRARALWIESTS
jgi:hypothetical protein